jgi:SsrA-binding protein
MRTVNKKANFHYRLEPEKIEAGISLRGAEAKAIRENRVDLSDATVRIMNGEAFLINATIVAQGLANYDATRIRKLLLHKAEVIALETRAKQAKLTLVPIVLYTKGRLVKLEIRLGKPKRKFEKRASIKAQDIKREIEQEFKVR